ncbi:hypothetical protein GAYE_SCF53G6169 [Galdieria yellowstonensis]|uniref:Uncharacterized protein n=1 Tax=Galdieria yellowstonensis TaxID=3028027 RepID=A0AAV9ILQ7_9RHOD|nr:hypothetical protein GAYE_SCF53G6169 [Galdieria yellowstonensis]
MDGIEKSRRKCYVVRRKERWTEEEHERFLAGLEQFGRNWRAIERIVRTKTAVQVRSHAQRYFIREAKRKEQGPSTSQTASSDGPLSDRSYGLNETTSQDSNYSRPQNTANVGIPSYEEQGRYSDPGKTRREIAQGNPSTWAPWGSGYDQQAEQGFANLHPHQAPASGQNSTSKYIELSYINFWMECQDDRFLEKSFEDSDTDKQYIGYWLGCQLDSFLETPFENVVPSPPTTPQEQQRTYPAVSKDTRAPSISPSESRYYSQYRYPPFVPDNNMRTYRNTPPPPPPVNYQPPPLNYQPPPWWCVERRRDAQVSTKEENSLPSFSELVASCRVELRPSTSQLNVSVPCPQGSSFFSQAQSRPLSMTSEGFHDLGSCNRNVSTLGSCTYLPCQGRYGEVFKYSSFGNQQYTDWNKMMGNYVELNCAYRKNNIPSQYPDQQLQFASLPGRFELSGTNNYHNNGNARNEDSAAYQNRPSHGHNCFGEPYAQYSNSLQAVTVGR